MMVGTSLTQRIECYYGLLGTLSNRDELGGIIEPKLCPAVFAAEEDAESEIAPASNPEPWFGLCIL